MTLPTDIHTEWSFVLNRWVTDPDIGELTLDRMSGVAARFVRYATAQGVETFTSLPVEVCEGFVNAVTMHGTPPSSQTRHFRRTTIRVVLRTLRHAGVNAVDPTVDLVLPARGGVKVRALTDLEVELCRAVSRSARANDSKRPAAWALGEATGTTGDIPLITSDHVVDDGDVLSVTFPDSRTAAQRTVTTTPWGAVVLRQRLSEICDGEPLCYQGDRHTSSGAAYAAASKLVGTVLVSADLTSDRSVRPMSVRLWRLQHEYETSGSLEHVAAVGGVRSFDALAQQLGVSK